MSVDRDLIFGALALQNEYIDLDQFTAVCRARASGKPAPVADLLVQRGWIDGRDRDEIERLVERKLSRHGNDPRQTLGAVADPFTVDLLRDVDDQEVRKSIHTLVA